MVLPHMFAVEKCVAANAQMGDSLKWGNFWSSQDVGCGFPDAPAEGSSDSCYEPKTGRML